MVRVNLPLLANDCSLAWLLREIQVSGSESSIPTAYQEPLEAYKI